MVPFRLVFLSVVLQPEAYSRGVGLYSEINLKASVILPETERNFP